MEKVLALILFLSLTACNQQTEDNSLNNAPEATEEKAKSTAEVISDIKTIQEEINQNIDFYEERSKEIEGESTEGGELKSYFQEGELKKLLVSHYGEMGQAIEEYYFSESQVVFVISKLLSYDKPVYLEGAKITKTEENSFYFQNQKLIQWLDPNNDKVSESNFGEQEQELLKEVQRLKDKLRTS